MVPLVSPHFPLRLLGPVYYNQCAKKRPKTISYGIDLLYFGHVSFTDMAMNASFEQPSGNQQSVEYDTIGEYETIVKTRPGPAAEVSPRQGSSIPGPAVGAGPGAMMNNRPGTTQEPICNPRCMLIVAIIYGILLAVIIAMLCFVMIQNFQTKANQGMLNYM